MLLYYRCFFLCLFGKKYFYYKKKFKNLKKLNLICKILYKNIKYLESQKKEDIYIYFLL